MYFIFTKKVKRGAMVCLLLLLSIGFSAQKGFGQTLAFPEAEGFGRYSEGGRHGEVYIVTNLNDSGPGSFRDAVSEPNRIVVFQVGGIIHIDSRIIVANNITIAGQTAPGDGVVIYGDGITFTQASNTIVRYLRVRMGRYGTYGADCMTMTDDAKNLIFDHVSASWGRDETFSVTGYADSITIQNSIISQGLETHSCGGLLEPSGLISLFRNLYIDNNTRNPKVKNRNEFVNNVVYNWGRGGGYIMGGSTAESRVNIINNYYIDGPSTSIRPFSRGTESFIPYAEGNYHDGNLNGVLDGTEVERSAYEGITTFAETPYDYAFPNQVMTARESYDYILEHAGATYPKRDQVDEFLMTELTSLGLEGKLISNERELPMGGPGEIFGAPARPDADQDGMPDEWEVNNGLDPNDPSDAMVIGPDGYANIEHYINGRVNEQPEDFLKPVTEVEAGDITPYTAQISWKNNDGRYEGIILEAAVQDGDYELVDTLAANQTEYLVEELEPNTAYQFRLIAFGENLTAIPSLSVQTKTVPIPTAPSALASPYPADGFSFADTVQLELQWTGSENTDYYLLYTGTDPSQLQLVDSLTANQFTMEGLESGKSHYWKVDAGNELGLTEGDVWSFSTRPYVPIGLVGAWLMDLESGTVVADSSSYANDGELNDLNDYSWTDGKVNGALDFTQAENPSHIYLPHEDQLYFDKHSFSISMWVKSSEIDGQKYLIHKGTFSKDENTGGTGQWYGIEIKDHDIRFAVDDNDDKTQLSNGAEDIFTGEWVHLVAIRNREKDVLQLYIDGKLVEETSDRTEKSIGQLEPIILGNSNGFGTPFKGLIDEVRLFNKSLDEQEVLELFHTLPTPMKAIEPSLSEGAILEGYEEIVPVNWNGGVNTTSYQVYLGTDPDNLELVGSTPVNQPTMDLENLEGRTTYFWRVDAFGPKGTTQGDVWSFRAAAPAGLVGYWKMDSQTGEMVPDHSQYGQDGMAQGFGNLDREDGKFGKAFHFDQPNSTASIDIPHEDFLTFDETSFTISMWVKIPEDTYRYGDGKDCYLIHKGQFSSSWYGIQLRDGRLTFAIDDDRTKTSISTSVSNSSSHPIFNNEWVHLVAIRDKDESEIRFYINGEETGSTSSSTGSIGMTDPLRLGNSPEEKPYRDLMDDVRLYNYALDKEEIKNLYLAPPRLDLVYKNGEVSKPDNNQIQPEFQLVNQDTLSVYLEDITARYWFTAENFTAIKSRVDYAAMGNGNVNMTYHSLEMPHEEAFGYMEYSFDPSVSITSGENSGIIKTAIYDQDWSDFDETNDYSMMETSGFASNPNFTLYYKGELIWGEEPEEQDVQQMAKVYLKTQSGSDNTLKRSFRLDNTGNVPLDYEGLSFRYWFTKEEGGSLNFWPDYAQLGSSNILGAFVGLSEPLTGADHYLEIKVDSNLGQLAPLSNSGDIKTRITKSDWSDFDAENDYSQMDSQQLELQEKITVYYYGELIFGTEPKGYDASQEANLRTIDNMESKQVHERVEEGLEIIVFPNPTQGHIHLEWTEASKEPVSITIFDANGVKKGEWLIDQKKADLDISSLANGVYLLYVNIDGRRTVHKVIKE